MPILIKKIKPLYFIPINEGFEQGQKFVLQQDFDEDGIPNIVDPNPISSKNEPLDFGNLTNEEKEQLTSISKEYGVKILKAEAIQNIVGLLFNEYYNQEKEFGTDSKLVVELQSNLKTLEYDLGNSGKNKDGVDGDLGAKTKTAIGNFEHDYSDEIRAMAEQKKMVQDALPIIGR